jgi:hypothetical protein
MVVMPVSNLTKLNIQGDDSRRAGMAGGEKRVITRGILYEKTRG